MGSLANFTPRRAWGLVLLVWGVLFLWAAV